MPYGNGSTNGGGGDAPAFGGGTPPTQAQRAARGLSKAPTFTVVKNVSYVASGTNSNQILSISGTDSDTKTVADAPTAVSVRNNGLFPVVALLGYQHYSDEDTENNTIFVHTLLLPGETIYPNMRGIISTQGSQAANTHGSFGDRSLWNLGGEVLDFTAPNTALKVDTTLNSSGASINNTTDPVNFGVGNSAHFRVGDIIRIDASAVELMEIIGTAEDNPTGVTIGANDVRVRRGLFGTDAAAHGSTADIYLPIFNEYYDYDRALSGNTQLVQTDGLGRFKSSNFFGYGRDNSTTAPTGLVPGSVCIRFYSSAYHEVAMGGTGVAGGSTGANIPINASTDSKLTASTEYSMNLICDDSLETTVSFTVDSDNTKFGGTAGIISKINDAILTATRTAGNNLFGYSCRVGIVNGMLRFTSSSHLLPHDGTNGSKMQVKDGAGGTNVFTGAAGIFPDINLANEPVKPTLPDLNVYDPITYATSPNMTNICYDDSYGNLLGAATGKVNYETGSVDFTGLSNASFEVSVVHNSPHSGKLDANKSDANTLKSIHANMLNKTRVGSIEVKTYA